MLKVINSGVFSSIQDFGRYDYMDYGVPISGMMDQYSGQLANLIIGNNFNDAVLEITNYGSSFQFLTETIICITGADLGCTLNDKLVLLNHSIKIKSGDVLKFSKPNFGVRSYVGVKGGFLNKPVLGSRSFFKEVTKKYILKKDDEILYHHFSAYKNNNFASVKTNIDHFLCRNIEVYKGPEYELLTDEQKDFLNKTTFTISKEHNRMGYKLNEVLNNELGSMLTSSVLPGTVQLTPSGKLIVLMRDCGVTGGYPRVLLLTNDAINKMAQKTTNDHFNFKLIALNL